jgi:hypothetical protein
VCMAGAILEAAAAGLVLGFAPVARTCAGQTGGRGVVIQGAVQAARGRVQCKASLVHACRLSTAICPAVCCGLRARGLSFVWLGGWRLVRRHEVVPACWGVVHTLLGGVCSMLKGQ